MTALEEFAQDVFNEYNSEGSRTATNIEEVEKTKDSVTYEYDYTSLNGMKKRLRKTFSYDPDGKMKHSGPIEV